MIILVVRRYYEPHEFVCQSIAEAAQMAIDQLDVESSFPDYIEVDGVKIWEQNFPFDIVDGLKKLISGE